MCSNCGLSLNNHNFKVCENYSPEPSEKWIKEHKSLSKKLGIKGVALSGKEK